MKLCNFKCFRAEEFTKTCRTDSKTGLFRGKHDVARSGLLGPLTYVKESPKCNFKKIFSRCPPHCPICHGSEPGCPGGQRTETKYREYQESVAYVEQKLRQENDKYERYLVFYRTFALLHYLRLLTFSSGNPSQVFFSIYYHYQCVTVQRNPSYRIKSVAFQNQLDSTPFLTWKREKRCLVLSPEQKKFLMCLGEITRLLAIRLVPSIQKWGCHARSSIFERFFGKDSICRLTGGLDPNDDTYRNRTTKYYFGE
jgi:hypothetical protein